jgi:hypothetical protein
MLSLVNIPCPRRFSTPIEIIEIEATPLKSPS